MESNDEPISLDTDTETQFWELMDRYRKLDDEDMVTQVADACECISGFHFGVVLYGEGDPMFTPQQMRRAVKVALQDLSDHLAKFETRFAEFQSVICQIALGKASGEDLQVSYWGFESALKSLFPKCHGRRGGRKLLDKIDGLFRNGESWYIYEALEEPLRNQKQYLAIIRDMDTLLSRDDLPEKWKREYPYPLWDADAVDVSHLRPTVRSLQ